MKVALLVSISVLLGLFAGAGMTSYELTRPTIVKEDVATPIPGVAPPELLDSHLPQPRVVVDETEFNFGSMEAGASGSHSFIFRNEGEGPLRLTVLSTTCQCTVGDVTDGEIAPGQSVPVTLTWTPKEHETEFRQTAVVSTTDPNPSMRKVTLTIHGRVTHEFEVEPRDMVISQVAGGKPGDAEVDIFLFNDEWSSPDRRPEIVDHEFTNALTADQFQVEFKPLDESRLAGREAMAGLAVIVTAPASLAVGANEQQLRLETNIPQHREITIPIRVDVTPNILILGGAGTDVQSIRDYYLLSLGSIESQQGIERELTILHRGELPGGQPLRVEFVSAQPEYLTVTAVPLEGGTSGSSRLKFLVQIPPGQRPASHASRDQGGLGEIVLSTNLDYHPQIRILVSFIIE